MEVLKSNVECRKSKLVTLCSTSSTNNDGFGPLFPPFVYKGQSRSEKTEVQVSFPSYRDNLMFYEHFKDINAEFPSALSFMFVGGNEEGEINYEFQQSQYKYVTEVHFSNEFATVNCMFQIVSKLKSCIEVRIYLSNVNITSSKNEASIVEALFKPPPHPPYKSDSVNVLKLKQDGEISPDRALAQNRFEHILTYALLYFPNLLNFTVEKMDGGGRTYDMVEKFCKHRQKHYANFPVHSFSITDGKTSCQPVVPSHQRQHVNKNEIHRTISNPQQAPENTINNYQDPRLQTLAISINPNNGPTAKCNLKIETDAKTTKSLALDVYEIPVQPKEPPEIVTISDEEESGESLQRVKKERLVENNDLLASPVSTSSMCTMPVSSPTSHMPIHSLNSLANIGSSYNDWENSSNDGDEELGDAPVSGPIADFVATCSTDFLKSILNNAAATQDNTPPNINSRHSPYVPRKKKYKPFEEGVHFYRR